MSAPSLLRVCAHLFAAMGLALAGARLATAQTLPLPPQAPQPQALTAAPPVTLPAEVAGALARLTDAIEAAGFHIDTVLDNTEYQFRSDRASNATAEYGVTSISLLARRT